MNYCELGEKYFKEGYNCAQATLLAFESVLSLDAQTLLKISSSFGGGFGRLREVCGAVSGMCMVAGLLKGYTDTGLENKKEHYALVQRIIGEFKKEAGDFVCKNLLAPEDAISRNPNDTKRDSTFYKKRPCVELVKLACQIVEREILDK